MNKIVEERMEKRGCPVQSMERAARLARMIYDIDIDAIGVCKVLMSVKMAREAYKHDIDNIIDFDGYKEVLKMIHKDTAKNLRKKAVDQDNDFTDQKN